MLEEENKHSLNEDSLQYLKFLKISSLTLKSYIDGILSFYKTDALIEAKKDEIDLNTIVEVATKMIPQDDALTVKCDLKSPKIKANEAALLQIILNLFSNAYYYNAKPIKEISVMQTEDNEYFYFTIADNGNGIKEENFEKIFDLFITFENENRIENKGSGIGLATVKKVVKNLGGQISVKSIYGEGSEFSFSLAK